MSDFIHPHYLFILVFLTLGLLTALGNFVVVRRFDHYPPARTLPRLSVLVPARNEEKNIEACLVSLLTQEYPDFEVIALDDHSSDDTPNILARL